jgi:hypothetical protein
MGAGACRVKIVTKETICNAGILEKSKIRREGQGRNQVLIRHLLLRVGKNPPFFGKNCTAL